MTLIVNYRYRIYPNGSQEQTMLHWLEISRQVYNYALREIKDWVNSRDLFHLVWKTPMLLIAS